MKGNAMNCVSEDAGSSTITLQVTNCSQSSSRSIPDISPSIKEPSIACSKPKDQLEPERRERQKQRRQRRKERRKTREKHIAIKTMHKERLRLRDGSHPDLPGIHHRNRKRRVKEDVCIICLEGNADGKPVEMFSACCGQAYHVGCYIRQLSYDSLNKESSRECGVCRMAMPRLEEDGMYIKSYTMRGVSTLRAHRGKRELRQRTFLHSNDICYNISREDDEIEDDDYEYEDSHESDSTMDSSSSNHELSLYLFTES